MRILATIIRPFVCNWMVVLSIITRKAVQIQTKTGGENLYKLYEKLRDERKVRDADVAKATGIPPTTISDWKRRAEKNPDATVSVMAMFKIAEYFGVSLDYFRG